MIVRQFGNKILNGDYELYYNQDNLLNRISDAYLNKIIIDGGKYVMIEEPHGYKSYPEHYLYFENNYSIGIDECNQTENYIIMNCLESIRNLKELNNIQLIIDKDLNVLRIQIMNWIFEINIERGLVKL